jgi:hypothetical protein
MRWATAARSQSCSICCRALDRMHRRPRQWSHGPWRREAAVMRCGTALAGYGMNFDERCPRWREPCGTQRARHRTEATSDSQCAPRLAGERLRIGGTVERCHVALASRTAPADHRQFPSRCCAMRSPAHSWSAGCRAAPTGHRRRRNGCAAAARLAGDSAARDRGCG